MNDRVPLSKSNLWQRQQQYYKQHGISAWGGGVPYYATSNPTIANSYANIIINYIREIKDRMLFPKGSPVYIVELGAGSGTFSFYILKRLSVLAESLQLDKKAFVYVMTDMVESNMEFWSKQTVFQDYIAEGILDFAQFDLEQDTDLILKNSGISIGKTACGPTIFIANYVFDTLRHDIFEISQGEIKEGLIKLDPQIGNFSPNQGIMFDEIDGGLVYQPVELPYYQEPELDNVFEFYQNAFQNCFLSIPIGTIEAIKRLRALTHDRLLLLSTDKGYSQHFQYFGEIPHNLVFHDECFSMTVNYHAIGQYFERLGGDCYHQDNQQSIVSSAFALGVRFQDLPMTRQVLHNYLNVYSPGNLFTLNYTVETTETVYTLEHIIASLSISNWDPWVFNSYLNIILQQIKSPYVTKSEIFDLCNCLKKVADNIYYIPGQVDALANIGFVFQSIGEFEEALIYYQKSIEQVGKADTILYNMALCNISLNQREKAQQLLEEAVTVNPDNIMAIGWITRIRESQNAINGSIVGSYENPPG